MKQVKSVIGMSLFAIVIGLSGCSGDDDKAAATSQPASPAKPAQTAEKKDFPKASEVPASRPPATVTNVDQVPEGLSNDPNKQYSEPAAKPEVKTAPRPNTETNPPKNTPKNGKAAQPSTPAAAGGGTSTAGQASAAQQGSNVQESGIYSSPDVKPSPAAFARGDYSGRGPFPGESGYLYGAYPRVEARATAQALYISPYSGQGHNAVPLQGGAIYFANNSAILAPQDIAQLQVIAQTALAHGKILQIAGHASADRSTEAKARNAQLSAARAQAVAAQLQAWGVPPSLIQISAYGDNVASVRGQTGAFDRRVDIFFVN